MTKRSRKDKSKRHSAKSSPSSVRIKKKKSESLEIKSKNQDISVSPQSVSPFTPGTLTPQKREEFLDRLRTHSNVTQAAGEVSISTVSLYALKKRDAAFAAAWDDAIKEGSNCLENEAKRRAMGYEEDVYKKGEYVGKVKKYSDLLLLALLNAHWPEKYRPQRSDAPPAISPDDAKRITEARDVLKRLDTDELAAIATVMEKATTRAVSRSTQSNGKRVLQ